MDSQVRFPADCPPLKHTQRLDYGRLAEVLHERGLAGLDAIRELLQLSKDGGMPFCEALVTSNLVSDWDLSKVVCETFQLPFLPVDLINPNLQALEEIDVDFFRKHQIVPVDIFGQVLTVAMPALVPAEVLAHVSALTDFVVLPMVGTVESNRRWINEHMSTGPAPDLAGGWESMFDAADAELAAEVGDGLGALDDMDEPAMAGAHDPEDLGLDAGLDLGSLDLGAIEALPADDLDIEPIDDGSGADTGGTGGLDLPPMPKFDPGQRDAG